MRCLVPGCDLRDNNISQLTFIHGDTNFILAAAGDTWVTTLLVTITDSWYHSSKSKLCHIHILDMCHCSLSILSLQYFPTVRMTETPLIWCSETENGLWLWLWLGLVTIISMLSAAVTDIPLLKRKNLPHLLNDNCFFLAFLPFQSCAVAVLNVRCEVWLLCDDPTSRQDGTATATRADSLGGSGVRI